MHLEVGLKRCCAATKEEKIVFTTKTQRAKAATEEENIINRKEHSAAKPQPRAGRSPAKTPRRKGKSLSFRTKREIFPRSLAFARDDRSWACHLASLRLGARNIRIRKSSTSGTFARAAQMLNYSNAKGARCHFDRREKSILDPSHALGMTG